MAPRKQQRRTSPLRSSAALQLPHLMILLSSVWRAIHPKTTSAFTHLSTTPSSWNRHRAVANKFPLFASTATPKTGPIMNHSSPFTSHDRARRVGLDQIQECGKRLRDGGLVSFPTETVYGLGANAMDESAF
mmetsp:Transcript_14736/g.32119  ORF Transcript_14736/g.32119 Transcript_14736/m.32119 type:complete len:132 (+) Transcript_14736:1970-2365(+)